MRCVFTGLAFAGDVNVEGSTRSMECELVDYMKIMQDQIFMNSPFFDGMNDYSAIAKLINMASFTATPLQTTQGTPTDPYPPASLINAIANQDWSANNEYIIVDPVTGQTNYFTEYTLPSAYDILQSPFFKFADFSHYDEAFSKIATIASKVCYFDRFGRMRYDVRPDLRFTNKLVTAIRTPKANFFTSPLSLVKGGFQCSNFDLLAIDPYTYKQPIGEMYNEIFLMTTTPEGEYYVDSVLNYPGRYDPTSPGWIGYAKRFMQAEGVWGSAAAIQSIAKYYAAGMFNPPITVSWKSMGVPHLQCMDIVTFTALDDDATFPASNVEQQSDTNLSDLINNKSVSSLPKTATLVLTSVTGTIEAATNTWINEYSGEWLYGPISTLLSANSPTSG